MANKLNTYTTQKGNTVADLSGMTSAQKSALTTGLKNAGYDTSNLNSALSKWKSDNGVNNTSGYTIGQSNYDKIVNTPSKTTNLNSGGTNKNYLVTAGNTGNYADITNKAQAYLTGGTYTPGQAIDTNWWGTGGGKALMYGNNKTYKGQAMTATDIAKAYEYANLYDQAIADQKLAEYTNMEKIYQQMIDAQQQQYEANQLAAQQRIAETVAGINANKDTVNSEYEKAQKENYVNKVLQENQMGDYLSALGYSGGLAESTLQGINNNYATNRQTATSERDSALRQIEQLAAEAQASGNSDLAELASEYMNNYISTLQNKAQMNYQISENQRDQSNADRDYLLQLKQQQLNQQMYDDERSDAEQDAAAQIAANDFETFLNTYEGKYTKEATYKKWIENLQKMADPYGYNKQKIAYLTQYINSGLGSSKKKIVSGGGSGTTSENYEAVKEQALANMYGNSSYGMKVGGQTDAVTYIKNARQKGLINDTDVETMLKELGIQ